jgi:FAD/FMN-containing dehydrogenase
MTQALSALLDRVTGPVICPGDDTYDQARRVYNAMIEARPAAVVRCATADDVVAVVRHAAETGMELAVRGGEHSVPGFGTADGAIVADLSGLQAVAVDDEARTATAGGGATWGRFNDVTAAHGLATTGGMVSTTGVGGLTLGGGIGYLCRQYGLTCDNLQSARVVTAEGALVNVSEDEHPDLFWAVRGGGGNFGVVTEFTFRLHPVTEILGGPMFFQLPDAPAVLAHYRDLMRDAPREYDGFPAFQLTPPVPVVPEDRVGEPSLAIVSCWTGPTDEGQAILDGFRAVASPFAEMVGSMPYPVLNSAFDPLVPPGLQHYWKAAYLSDLPDEAITVHMDHAARAPAINTAVHIYPMNGAVHDVPGDATAFGHRDANFALVIAGAWPDPGDNERNIRWVRDYHLAVAPYALTGGYTNFASQDDADMAAENYGANYPRLREVKRRYDPDNLFHLNQNIPPPPAPLPRSSPVDTRP